MEDQVINRKRSIKIKSGRYANNYATFHLWETDDKGKAKALVELANGSLIYLYPYAFAFVDGGEL